MAILKEELERELFRYRYDVYITRQSWTLLFYMAILKEELVREWLRYRYDVYITTQNWTL